MYKLKVYTDVVVSAPFRGGAGEGLIFRNSQEGNSQGRELLPLLPFPPQANLWETSGLGPLETESMQRRLPGRGGLGQALGKERRKDFPEEEDDTELYYPI